MLSKRTLQQLIDLAREKSDNAALVLGTTHAREREEESKLKLLENYRGECLERFRQASSEGLDRQTWTNYHKFLAKLDAAIIQQREVVAQQRQKTDQSRLDWQAASSRLKSFDTLGARQRRSEHAAERRREQRVQNTVASRKRDPER